MPDDLVRSQDSLDMAIRALTRARQACDLNERLRCIHNGAILTKEAHDLIVGWRTGQAPTGACHPGEGRDPERQGPEELDSGVRRNDD